MITYPIDFRRIVDDLQWVREWNEKYPVGTVVGVWRDNGELLITRTKSQAYVRGYENRTTSFINVEGAGNYHLGAVRPLTFYSDPHIQEEPQIDDSFKHIEPEYNGDGFTKEYKNGVVCRRCGGDGFDHMDATHCSYCNGTGVE